MKIVVTTPTGNIGSKLTRTLLDRGAELTLVARNPDKVQAFASRGARVFYGEHSDVNVLQKALHGADALFFLIPGSPSSRDPLGDYKHFAEQGAKAIQRIPNLHVVMLSSIGADRTRGTGPVAGLHAAEQIFQKATRNLTILRPDSFMENALHSLPTIADQGTIYMSIPGSVEAPQIATQDIADVAAEFLLSRRKDHYIVDIAGPQNISFDHTARILSTTIGRPVEVVTVPPENLKQAMTQIGISDEMAGLLVELEQALAAGLGAEFHGDEKRTGKIPYEQFAREVFLPAYRGYPTAARAS